MIISVFDEYEDYTGDTNDDEEWEQIVDDAAAWDEEMEDELTQTTQPKPPAAVTRDIRGSPLPPGAVRRDLARQKREGPKPKMRKVRRTEKSTEREQESDDIVEFTHLLGSSEKPLDEDSTEDSEISDAIAHITSDTETKSKRKRPVRRKKPND